MDTREFYFNFHTKWKPNNKTVIVNLSRWLQLRSSRKVKLP